MRLLTKAKERETREHFTLESTRLAAANLLNGAFGLGFALATCAPLVFFMILM